MPRGMNLYDSRGNFFQSLFVNFVLIKEIFYMHTVLFNKQTFNNDHKKLQKNTIGFMEEI